MISAMMTLDARVDEGIKFRRRDRCERKKEVTSFQKLGDDSNVTATFESSNNFNIYDVV